MCDPKSHCKCINKGILWRNNKNSGFIPPDSGIRVINNSCMYSLHSAAICTLGFPQSVDCMHWCMRWLLVPLVSLFVCFSFSLGANNSVRYAALLHFCEGVVLRP